MHIKEVHPTPLVPPNVSLTLAMICIDVSSNPASLGEFNQDQVGVIRSTSTT
jgi:hypothetical protein